MKRSFFAAMGFLSAFAVWTAIVSYVDVRAIGPLGSRVGLSSLNGFVHSLTGVHMSLYTLTDWLGLIPVAVGFGFAMLGFAQWIRRKSITKVDRDLLVLGGFYIITAGTYLLFENVVINYRPVLIGGVLEASYPSSTTLLVLCVMPTAIMQLNTRIKHTILRRCTACAITAFIIFTVSARLISGVHWVTDIIGSTLLSAGLVLLYRSFSRPISNKS